MMKSSIKNAIDDVAALWIALEDSLTHDDHDALDRAREFLRGVERLESLAATLADTLGRSKYGPVWSSQPTP